MVTRLMDVGEIRFTQEHVYDTFNANSERAGSVLDLMESILSGASRAKVCGCACEGRQAERERKTKQSSWMLWRYSVCLRHIFTSGCLIFWVLPNFLDLDRLDGLTYLLHVLDVRACHRTQNSQK
ncbi:unnamed protein product [Durusdinium trenchii]|uniref:Uncharacterized protein n=1 Tax=Durusdinium trenchii TaxID=1381693 RepID=A0ABP0IPS2_9DINO